MDEPEQKLEKAVAPSDRGEERLLACIGECFGDLSFAPLVRYIKQEWSIVKAAPGATVAVALLAAVVAFTVKGCSDSGELIASKEQVGTLTTERNQAQTNQRIAENALAPWKTLANSQFPEKPINERMDLLFGRMATEMHDQFQQLGTQIERNAPVKTIVSASATIDLTIKSDGGSNSTDMFEAGVALGHGSSAVMTARANQYQESKPESGLVTYTATCSVPSDDPSVGKRFSALREADYLELQFSEMPDNAMVVSGKVVLVINGSNRLEFAIEPQVAQGKQVFSRYIYDELLKLKEPTTP